MVHLFNSRIYYRFTVYLHEIIYIKIVLVIIIHKWLNVIINEIYNSKILWLMQNTDTIIPIFWPILKKYWRIK